MLTLFSLLTLAQMPAGLSQQTPSEVVQPQEVRALPGQLDRVPVFNSNSPELIQSEGILLSTFPPTGMADPAAHLNFPFRGRFDVFAHNAFRALSPENLSSVYLGVIVYNPGDRPVTIAILQAASYLSQPDAPFMPLPPVMDNLQGNVYAGPGSRVMSDVLRGKRQAAFPPNLVVPPHGYAMLFNLPIPVRTLDPPLNGRSTLMRLRSNGTVYLASLALMARQTPEGSDRPPTLAAWKTLLKTGHLAGGRDRPPSLADNVSPINQIVYGRVAGVAEGSRWQAQVTDPSGNPSKRDLTIPVPGTAFSYGLSTLMRGRLGTTQIETAPILVRYPDTAYQAHGNYGIEYDLSLPLHNPTEQARTVTLTLQTPIKEDELAEPGLRFFDSPPAQIFFRGTVRFRYTDDQGLPKTRYVHLVQHAGQQGEPLIVLRMKGGDRRLVQFSFLYPPDATPPQVLTVRTLAE